MVEHGISWNLPELQEKLPFKRQPTRDVALGPGERLEVTDSTSLELYPDAAAARLQTEDALITLHRLLPPTVRDEQVVFESASADTHLTLSPSGEITLFIAPSRAEHRPSSEVAVPVELPADPEQPLRPEEAEKQPRVTLTGRVGATPAFRETRNKTTVARFPLVVHLEDGRSKWHQIVVFGKRGEKLRDTLNKADEVEVIGYVHTRESEQRNGPKKTVEEIYATVVKNRSKTE